MWNGGGRFVMDGGWVLAQYKWFHCDRVAMFMLLLWTGVNYIKRSFQFVGTSNTWDR